MTRPSKEKREESGSECYKELAFRSGMKEWYDDIGCKTVSLEEPFSLFLQGLNMGLLLICCSVLYVAVWGVLAANYSFIALILSWFG